ncbi:hypothetical protein [Cohnella silvisoli]|uniref:DUF2642 domain-containing protein n=1 Tax=Cohnella silvisoli TaxID=2873699 RepID=A0ABV1KPF2_9BACL|nr:hypothetical protein [Cohnella silvisoli]MCD9025551.1 hypothetical protein [Cohnella silvisoli]
MVKRRSALRLQRLMEAVRSPVKVPGTSDVAIGELNGQLVKDMEQRQAVIVIQTDRAMYRLPAEQIDIQEMPAKLGKGTRLPYAMSLRKS